MNEILEILVQFGGGRGGQPGNVAVRFLLPTFFWAVLAGVAFREWHRNRGSKDVWIGIASAMGMARELLMFTAEYGAWRKLVPFDFMYTYYPPLEHAVTMISCLFIGYAFLNYHLECPSFSRPFIIFSTIITLLLYGITAFQWPPFLAHHPGSSFGRFWGDLAFRTAASIFMGLVLGAFIHAAAQGKMVSKALMCGFIFLLLDEFLMIFNMISNERYGNVFAPIRHNLHIWAIPLFVATYWNDLSNRVGDAEQVVTNVFNLSPAMLCLIAFDGTFTVVSPASEQVLGIAPENLTGRRLADFGFDMRSDGTLAFLTEDGKSEAMQLQRKFVPEQGPARWLQWHLQPNFNDRIIYGVVADVTERKMVAEELLDERNKLEAIISCLGDGLSIQDHEYRIVYQNHILKKRFGDHVGEFCYRVYEGRSGICDGCPVADAFIDGSIHGGVRKILVDGTPMYLEITASPLKDNTGAIIGAIEIVRDISGRKAAEEAILTLNRELEQRVADRTASLSAACRELEAFSYSVSHDLRSPLRSIYGYSQLFLEDYGKGLNDQGRKYLDIIAGAAQRMEQIIDGMLGFSRISRSNLQCEAIDLSVVAQLIMAELQLANMARNVDISISEGIVAKGDPRLLRSVMENLLGNAWKYTSKMPQTVIEFNSKTENGEVVYLVRDNGAGFDSAHADKLFLPFQRLHNEQEFPGNGIGLATVQKIIQRHGGRIWAQSAPGEGATFYFTLGSQ